MIRIFYGDDRVKANAKIKSLLGENYEVVDGENLGLTDLPNIFLGASLLSDTRNILIRDLALNKPAFEQLTNYLNTPHNIILLESKLDTRTTAFKELKDKVEVAKFELPEDPIMFFGLLASQAIKDFSFNQGTKEKRVLKELAKLDLDMKSAKVEPWLLIESFLLRLSSLS